MSKRKLAALFAALVFLAAMYVSLTEFTVFNPLSAASGVLGVVLLEKEAVPVQQYPHRVVIARPDYSVMAGLLENQGYRELPEEQMGSLHVWESPAGEPEHILVQMNGYYAKWIWN